MKSSLIYTIIIFCALIVSFSMISCGDKVEAKSSEVKVTDLSSTISSNSPKKILSDEFKSYWYAGEAEITSYKLQQARYGELREGSAVLVYVTEPFLAEEQVKANRNNSDNISVLKLNSTKNYLTGIYPYSIMNSTFYPVYDNQHAVKVSTSVQEWCGHVYSQLNNRDQFEIKSHSYFEGEADQQLSLTKSWLENEIWTKIRINPADLPVGEIEMIPSFEYIRTAHKEFRTYKAVAELIEDGNSKIYSITYPALERTLRIEFSKSFPYNIRGWSETFKSGYGPNAKVLTSEATRLKELKTPYWRQNGIEDEKLRLELGI